VAFVNHLVSGVFPVRTSVPVPVRTSVLFPVRTSVLFPRPHECPVSHQCPLVGRPAMCRRPR
jgi:hypothetical protein